MNTNNSFSNFPADLLIATGLPICLIAIATSYLFSLDGIYWIIAFAIAISVAISGAVLLYRAKLPLIVSGSSSRLASGIFRRHSGEHTAGDGGLALVVFSSRRYCCWHQLFGDRRATNQPETDMELHIVKGDLLKQPVEVIVNAWNRNIIPWWLLLPQGVSGAIKRHGGTRPFREVARCGPIPLGNAVLTSAGRLPFRGIIHVAGINMLWRSSEYSVRQSVQNAMEIVKKQGFRSVAIPLIGAGSGGGSAERVQSFITDELSKIAFDGDVFVVQYSKG